MFLSTYRATATIADEKYNIRVDVDENGDSYASIKDASGAVAATYASGAQKGVTLQERLASWAAENYDFYINDDDIHLVEDEVSEFVLANP